MKKISALVLFAFACNLAFAQTDENRKAVIHAGYSLLPAFRIGQHIELFGGASINYMETKNMSARNVFPNHSLWKGDNATKLQQIYIGYQVGVQYIF